VSFELTEEAYATAGGRPVAAGLALGALTFFAGDLLIADGVATFKSESSIRMLEGRLALPETR